MARPGAPRARSRAAHIHALHTSHTQYIYHQMIALMYWANASPVCAAAITYRHDILIGGEQRKRRVNQAAGEQDLQPGSQPPTYLPAATLLDITYSLQLVNL